MGPPDLRDAPVVRMTVARLPNPWIEPEVADQLLRTREARYISDRSDQPNSDSQVDTGHGHQSPNALIAECGLGQNLVDPLKFEAETIKFLQPAARPSCPLGIQVTG